MRQKCFNLAGNFTEQGRLEGDFLEPNIALHLKRIFLYSAHVIFPWESLFLYPYEFLLILPLHCIELLCQAFCQQYNMQTASYHHSLLIIT